MLSQNLTREQEELKICALALYWGEGAKSLRARVVDVANSDPALLQLFLRFLREVVHVNETRLRVYLYCFIDQDVVKLKEFWSEKLQISQQQFSKPYIRPTVYNNSRRMHYGVAHVRYNDVQLLKYILFEIENLKLWAGCRAVKCSRL